jgi:glycosyltransferase involved in cell wall biosynthesis
MTVPRAHRPPVVAPFHLLIYSDAPVRGGAEMTLAMLLSRLPEQIRVSVLGVDREVVDWLAGHRPGTDVHVIAAINDRSDLAGMRAHRAAFRRFDADIVQFNLSTLWSCQWAMAAALSIPGQRAIAVENSPMGSRSNLSNRLKRWTSARLAGHVAVGERTARTIEAWVGLPDHSVRHLYHGVEVIEHHPPPRVTDGPVIGTIARHDPVKGVDVLLRALPLLDESVRLVLIGDGPERDALVSLTAELGLVDRVEFRDVPWTERAGDHLAGFDVFVLPSRLEGFPVTIMEAMLAGVPVVATDVGSVRESVTDGVTGRVVAPEDPAALAAAITDVLGDDARRRAMGEAGRLEALERFTLDATTAAYCRLYDEILSRPGSRVVLPTRRQGE